MLNRAKGKQHPGVLLGVLAKQLCLNSRWRPTPLFHLHMPSFCAFPTPLTPYTYIPQIRHRHSTPASARLAGRGDFGGRQTTRPAAPSSSYPSSARRQHGIRGCRRFLPLHGRRQHAQPLADGMFGGDAVWRGHFDCEFFLVVLACGGRNAGLDGRPTL